MSVVWASNVVETSACREATTIRTKARYTKANEINLCMHGDMYLQLIPGLSQTNQNDVSRPGAQQREFIYARAKTSKPMES